MGRASVLSLVVVCFILTLRLRVSNADNNPEVEALLAFRQALNDPHDNLQSWDPTFPNPCIWLHVKCDGSTITRIDLGRASLSGPLVPELGNLKNLKFLEVYSNKINGSIPKELGQLTQLVSLDLYDNNLTGDFPPELVHLSTTLEFLRLNDNPDLSGIVPKDLSCGPKLQVKNVTGTGVTLPIC